MNYILARYILTKLPLRLLKKLLSDNKGAFQAYQRNEGGRKVRGEGFVAQILQRGDV